MLGSYGSSDVGLAPPLLTKNVTTGNIALALAKEEYAKVSSPCVCEHDGLHGEA